MTSPAPSPLGRRSLRGSLLRAVAVIGATLVLLCILSTVAVTRLGGAIGLILRENYVSVVACQEMNEALERQDSAALFAASGRTDIATPMLLEHRAGFKKAFEREAHNITLPGEGPLVRELGRLYQDYLREVDRVLEGPRGERIDGYFKELLPRFSGVRAKVTAIRQMNQENMEWADQRARHTAERTLEIAIFVTALALIVAGWFAWQIPKTVLEPIVSFTKHARAIGEGKLDATVPDAEVSELRTLGEAFHRMQEKLRAYRESSLGELLAAKDLSRATITSMVDPVIVFSSSGDVLLTNDAAESTFGLTSGDRDLLRRGGVEIPEPLTLARDAVLAQGEPLLPQSLSDAMRWITADGEKYFLVRASPLQSEDASPAGVIVVAQDVTRFRRIDALKSDVVATVSHELKTPLTSLRLATHMLLEASTGELEPMQRELAVTARDETERLQSTVNELLDLVRIEREAGALNRAPVNAAALLQEVASAHQKVAEMKHIRLTLENRDARALVELDAEQIAIVLGNLLSNAIRHCRDGGHVWLGSYVEAGDHVFSVKDDGDGIAAENLSRIFERHWSGAEPSTLKGRHGLGLAIAQEIATRHGGKLEVESELGKGSTFRLRLPLTRAAESSRAEAAPN
ncbi:MAG TPA: ATP-binding protein [Polyangiaceae bacterium]|jgi:signal transduction histidine kinase|nr:ATP-binding protein [Polyangiaceae bacterium]